MHKSRRPLLLLATGLCLGVAAAPAGAARTETVPRVELLQANGTTAASDGASTHAIAYFGPRDFELAVRPPGRAFSRPWRVAPLGGGDGTAEVQDPPKIAFGPDGTVLVAWERNDGSVPFQERVGGECCTRVYAAALRPDGRRMGPWPISPGVPGVNDYLKSVSAGDGGRMAVSWRGSGGWQVRVRGTRGGWGPARTVARSEFAQGVMAYAGKTLVTVTTRGPDDGPTVVERREGFGRPRVLARFDQDLLGGEYAIDRRGGVTGQLSFRLRSAGGERTHEYLLESRPGTRTRIRDLRLDDLGTSLIGHPSGAAALIAPGGGTRVRPAGGRFGAWHDLQFPVESADVSWIDSLATVSSGGRLSVWRNRYAEAGADQRLYLAQATSRRGGRARLVSRLAEGSSVHAAIEDRRGPIAVVIADRRVRFVRP